MKTQATVLLSFQAKSLADAGAVSDDVLERARERPRCSGRARGVPQLVDATAPRGLSDASRWGRLGVGASNSSRLSNRLGLALTTASAAGSRGPGGTTTAPSGPSGR